MQELNLSNKQNKNILYIDFSRDIMFKKKFAILYEFIMIEDLFLKYFFKAFLYKLKGQIFGKEQNEEYELIYLFKSLKNS